MAEADYVVVGSGINGLVCAAMPGLKGRRVTLLERNDRIGDASAPSRLSSRATSTT